MKGENKEENTALTNLSISKRDRTKWEFNAKNILFKGVLWYKLTSGISWSEIGLRLKKNGHKYNDKKFRDLISNWSANHLVYYYNIYDTLQIPTPTPELILYWDQEIKRMQAEKEARLRAKREEREAKRAARAGKR